MRWKCKHKSLCLKVLNIFDWENQQNKRHNKFVITTKLWPWVPHDLTISVIDRTKMDHVGQQWLKVIIRHTKQFYLISFYSLRPTLLQNHEVLRQSRELTMPRLCVSLCICAPRCTSHPRVSLRRAHDFQRARVLASAALNIHVLSGTFTAPFVLWHLSFNANRVCACVSVPACVCVCHRGGWWWRCWCGGCCGPLRLCSITLIIQPAGFVHSSFGAVLEEEAQFKSPPQGQTG